LSALLFLVNGRRFFLACSDPFVSSLSDTLSDGSSFNRCYSELSGLAKLKSQYSLMVARDSELWDMMDSCDHGFDAETTRRESAQSWHKQSKITGISKRTLL
jgi:hypothetical protein